MTVTAPARAERPGGLSGVLRVGVALAAIVTIVLVGLAGLLAPPASAGPLTGPGNAVGVFGAAGGQVVGAHEPVLAGQRRARAPSYDRTAVGSCVAAEGEPAGFSIRDVNPSGSNTNCVNCSIATDETLAGRPTVAQPSGPQFRSVLEQRYGGQFQPVGGQADIEQMLQNAGPGARGIVYGSPPPGSNLAHVFNAVNQGGDVRFLDGQIGGPASFNGYPRISFLWTNVP